MGKLTDQEVSRLKIAQFEEKLRILKQRGKTSRDEDVKYYREQLAVWQAYADELAELDCPVHHGDVELGKTIMGSGAYHIKAICAVCGRNVKGTGQWVSHKVVPPEVTESLVILDNFVTQMPVCEVCGAPGVELHHWAPKELFPETYERWPKSYLCKKHHDEWHQAVTNPLRALRRREAA
jgi:hypothetical protein